MTPFIGEVIGTTILILLGNGVVANVVLADTKGHGSGWIVISAGWGFAVFTAVLCVSEASGAHLNPAVTVGLAIAGEFSWSSVPSYCVAQLIGALLGASLVFYCHLPHYRRTKDPDAKLATFCTSAAIRTWPTNFLSEVLGTFVLIYAVLKAQAPTFSLASESAEVVEVGLGAVGAFPVGIVVFTIGLCLGGHTGYAINPIRDFGPRLAHALLPVPDKRDSDWSYAPIPILGPLAGAAAAAGLFLTFG